MNSPSKLLTMPCALLIGLAGCTSADLTVPRERSLPSAEASTHRFPSTDNGGRIIPGTRVSGAGQDATSRRLGCAQRDPQYGSADIGPRGGVLRVGANWLIVPPGALTTTQRLTGFIPADTSITIELEPHGLRFQKPAGLILDASTCTNVPNVVYLDEQGVVAERIRAVYSTWWHTIAAPIDHFSNYAIAF